MPITSERQQPIPRRNEKGAQIPELQKRYGAIGISAVAAAMRYRDDAKPIARERQVDPDSFAA